MSAKEVKGIFATTFAERAGTKVPEPEDVKLGNDAVTLDGTVLYADLAESTTMVNNYKNWFAAKVYKSILPDLPRAGQLALRLEAAGIDLASVTDVVLTHMHMDHIGGLTVDGVKERLRRDLRIHVAAAEVKFWESPDFTQTSMPPGFPDALRSAVKRFMKQYRSHLRLFDEEYEVAPDVIVRRTGGHTPGHSVVHLASGGDRRTTGGDSPSVPIRRAGGVRWRRLSLGTGLLGLLTAC